MAWAGAGEVAGAGRARRSHVSSRGGGGGCKGLRLGLCMALGTQGKRPAADGPARAAPGPPAPVHVESPGSGALGVWPCVPESSGEVGGSASQAGSPSPSHPKLAPGPTARWARTCFKHQECLTGPPTDVDRCPHFQDYPHPAGSL